MSEIGFKNLKFDVMTNNDTETYEGNIRSLGKAVGFKLTPSIDSAPLYGDDGLAEDDTELIKYDIEINVTELNDANEIAVLGHTKDTVNGGVITKKGDNAPFIGLYGVKTFSGGREKHFWLTKVKLSEVEETSTTKGEKLEKKIVTLKGSAYARLRDNVAKHSVFSDDPLYNAATYASSVYELPSKVSVTSISLNKSTETVTVGATKTLTVSFTPTDATNKQVTWFSTDTSKATVDQNGKIKGIAAGTATVTAVTNDGNNTASCSVTVS